MNLYRNFGSMLETWVVTTDPDTDPEEDHDTDPKQDHDTDPKQDYNRDPKQDYNRDPKQDPDTEGVEGNREDQRVEGPGAEKGPGAEAIRRFESEDSGFETENTPSTPGSLQGSSPPPRVPSERGGGRDGRVPPLLSSHSFSCCSPVEPGASSISVEQALQRAAQTGPRGPHRATPPPVRLRCHSINTASGSGQRSGVRKVIHPPSSAEPCSILTDPQPSLSIHETNSQSLCEEEASSQALRKGLTPELGLSPGLGYLEQVCRMLEEIARLQLRNQELQRKSERESLPRCLPFRNTAEASQGPDTVGREDLSSHRLQPPHARHRSMSDPWELIRDKWETERPRQTSWRETREETDGPVPSGRKQEGRAGLVLKLKTGSLHRGSSLQDPVRQPAQKNASKKIAQLFKKRVNNTSAS